MNILTFDLEEWFHLLDHQSTKTEMEWNAFSERIRKNTDRILELLGRHQQKATFFCLGWIARKYPDVIRKITAEGHEIACHSDMHQPVYEQTPAHFREDLRSAIGSIEDACGKKVITYRAPGFSITTEVLWAFDILAESGILIDSSIFPARRTHGGFPFIDKAQPSIIHKNGIEIKEFPINTFRIAGKPIIFSGGGYFRLIPYFFIRRISEKSEYILTYFHPRDMDPGQPTIKDLPVYRKFKSSVGLNSAEKKLSHWLSEFPFINMETAVNRITWDQVPIIHL